MQSRLISSLSSDDVLLSRLQHFMSFTGTAVTLLCSRWIHSELQRNEFQSSFCPVRD